MKILTKGGVAVVRTDTLYGVLASAHNEHAVSRIFSLKNRNPLKPVIVLISSLSDISSLGISVSDEMNTLCMEHWPGPVSIVIPSNSKKDLHYLHKGTGSIAFRLPDNVFLQELIAKTGPLVAPSANPEGMPPATNIKEAMRYFSHNVDYYHDGGQCDQTKASTILKLKKNYELEVIRP